MIWKQTWPNRFGRGLTTNWITKTLLSYNTVQQKSFCGSSARWRKGQYASMLCDRSDLRVSRTCNRLLMLSGKYGGVKLAHYGLVAPLTCHNWQIFSKHAKCEAAQKRVLGLVMWPLQISITNATENISSNLLSDTERKRWGKYIFWYLAALPWNFSISLLFCVNFERASIPYILPQLWLLNAPKWAAWEEWVMGGFPALVWTEIT